MTQATIRFAEESDCGLVLEFIKGLAVYEGMLDEVLATEDLLYELLFEKGIAKVLFVCEDGVEVGFALFFYSVATFKGRAGIYLEDLFVKPEWRGKGYGKALMRELARIAVDEGCARVDWVCLDWNEPSIEFYMSLGAEPKEEWKTFRLADQALLSLAQGEPFEQGGLARHD